jgi:hypothetical protein
MDERKQIPNPNDHHPMTSEGGERQTMRELTEDELALINHVMMWGSSSYPIHKLRGKRWTWDDWRSVKGCPKLFNTKREAVEAFERFFDTLLDAKAGRPS